MLVNSNSTAHMSAQVSGDAVRPGRRHVTSLSAMHFLTETLHASVHILSYSCTGQFSAGQRRESADGTFHVTKPSRLLHTVRELLRFKPPFSVQFVMRFYPISVTAPCDITRHRHNRPSLHVSTHSHKYFTRYYY